MSPRPALRLTRASVFAGVCTTLATAGHVGVAQTMVAPEVIGLGFAAVCAVAWVLTGAERSLATIFGGLLGGQFAIHALFSAARPGSPVIHHAGPFTLMPDGHNGMTMALAHLTAAMVSAWWLRRGERAVWRLARQVATLANRSLWTRWALLDSVPVSSRPRPPRSVIAAARPRSATLRHFVVRRGPPSRPTAPAPG